MSDPDPDDEMLTGDAFIEKYSCKELISSDEPTPWELIKDVFRRG